MNEHQTSPEADCKSESLFHKIVHFLIFESRWILMVFYVGLIAAQLMYAGKFAQNFYELCKDYNEPEQTFLVGVLNLLDIVMIANLIKMIVSGSYQTCIEKLDASHTEKTTSGALKIKMAASLVGVSGINLLQTFLNCTTVGTGEIVAKCIIHCIFVLSTMGLAWVEYLHAKSAH